VEKANERDYLSYRRLLEVLLVLLVLTGVTVSASLIDMGAFNIWLAIIIASLKSSLVLLFFMNLRRESSAVRITFLVTIVTLTLLLGFIFWDVSFR